MNENRGPWYLLTGLVLGLAISLIYVWVIHPADHTNTSPASLEPASKDRYRALIASAYQADGDLVRAKARLELLKDPDSYQALAGQAQRALADGSSPEEARALGLLLLALGQARSSSTTPLAPSPVSTAIPGSSPTLPQPVQVTGTFTATVQGQALLEAPLPAPGTPTPGSLPTSASSPTPAERIGRAVSLTVTPASVALKAPGTALQASPTPGAPFMLSGRDLACPKNLSDPLIEVQAYDAAGTPVPGVPVNVTWDGGAERFFTGLKPEQSPGYADFTMTSGITYTIQLGDGGQAVGDLAATTCPVSGPQRQWGAWVLSFRQP